MPFDSSGTFNRVIPGGWQADRDANIKITAVRHDAEDDGFATGLSTTITRTGVSTVLADIPFNNKKLTQLGEPTNANDAATKNYVDNFKSFTTGAIISGAGPLNGFLTFASSTGVNGIGWATADMSWIGRVAVTSESAKRLAVNDKPDGTGNDVFTVDEGGRVNAAGVYAQNLDYDGSVWRTTIAGLGTLWQAAGGALMGMINDVATTVAHQTATLRSFFTVSGTSGNTTLTMNMSGSGKTVHVASQSAGLSRWIMQMGNAVAESGSNVGSDFAILRYADGGGYLGNPLAINRSTGAVNIEGTLITGGALTTAGTLTFASYVQSSTTTAVFASAAGGNVYLRPNGIGSATGQFVVGPAGAITASGDMTNAGGITLTGAGNGILAGYGLRCKPGAASTSYSANWCNFWYANPNVTVYIDNTPIGIIATASDYRLKKDIKPLPSTWAAVKKLRPVQYSIRDWKIFTNDDEPRWGFVAHELQESLLKTAATGYKDEEEGVQSPDQWPVIAALAKALQEAMLRIEALEAKP